MYFTKKIVPIPIRKYNTNKNLCPRTNNPRIFLFSIKAYTCPYEKKRVRIIKERIDPLLMDLKTRTDKVKLNAEIAIAIKSVWRTTDGSI
jgi:hypothetical protein